MIQRPPGIGAFQFVVLASLRSAQLIRGCRPRVEGTHKRTVIAQMEVAEGKVVQAPFVPVALREPANREPAVIDNPLLEAVVVMANIA